MIKQASWNFPNIILIVPFQQTGGARPVSYRLTLGEDGNHKVQLYNFPEQENNPLGWIMVTMSIMTLYHIAVNGYSIRAGQGVYSY